ncbi:uncharacterized protein LOC142526745 [Primulina tabacum]|uniref:uncharacterized protein LOC142526745 n=1 Tax=Primulina tabacum TaxID=48773 RepID=UPI003F595061
MEGQSILYETLSPLAATSTASNPTEFSSEDCKSYVVFRNLISLHSSQRESPESPTVDYFSLKVNELEESKENLVLTSPLPQTPAEASTSASHRTLEGNWFNSKFHFKSPMLRLHREILDFCNFLSPTPEEQGHRNVAVESVFDVINYIWPDAKAEVFGSFKTGLCLPSSDIDVVILGSNVSSPQTGLHALSRALSQGGIAKKIQVIAKARVPIIKFVEKKSGIAFDISFDAHTGPQAAEFIKNAVSKWPPLRPLCLILKVFLQQRELNEVYTGGIGSYALLSMLIAMLRNRHDQAFLDDNLGVLLVNFFDMYGRKLNTVDVGVSCNGGRTTFFPKSNRGFSVEGRSSLISIEDPQVPDNDVGKSSFNFYQVRSAFAMAYSTLTNKTISRLGPKKSILGAIIRPDDVLLERKGGLTENATFNTLFPGAGERWEQLFDNQPEICCNWRLNDEDEEPLPLGKGIPGQQDMKSSRKKSKSSKDNSSTKEVKGSDILDRYEENGCTMRSRKKKKSEENSYLTNPQTNKQNWKHRQLR